MQTHTQPEGGLAQGAPPPGGLADTTGVDISWRCEGQVVAKVSVDRKDVAAVLASNEPDAWDEIVITHSDPADHQ
jgi:hypothetical protein